MKCRTGEASERRCDAWIWKKIGAPCVARMINAASLLPARPGGPPYWRRRLNVSNGVGSGRALAAVNAAKSECAAYAIQHTFIVRFGNEVLCRFVGGQA